VKSTGRLLNLRRTPLNSGGNTLSDIKTNTEIIRFGWVSGHGR
jgi:hypothetical protein